MNPDDFLNKLSEEDQAKKAEQDKADQIGAVQQSGDKVVEALKGHTNELTGSIHDLLMATLVSKDPKIAETAKNLAGLLGEIKNATKDIKGANFKPLGDNLSALQKTLTTVPKQIADAHKATDPTPLLQEIAKTLGEKNFNPNVSVKAPTVDLSPLTKILTDIKDAVSNEKEGTDTSKLEDLTQSVASAVNEVRDAVKNQSFPVPNYVLPFKDSNGKATQVQLDASGNIPTTGGGGGGGGTSSSFGSAFPSTGTAGGFSDGTNMQGGKVFDLDSGAGTDYVVGSSLRFAASGGSTAADSNSGNKSAATLRVVLATDQPQLTNKMLVTPDSVALPANQSVNISQINGVTPLMGNGTTGTGSQRVTIASDNTAFSVNATLSAETTKVIGTIRTADGAGNLYTTNSTTYTAKFAQDSNLLGTLGTAFSTAGKVDVKGADGDVFVRQATATNLKTQAENYQGGTAVSSSNPLQVTLANTGANTNKILVTPDSVALPANQSVNVAQMNGVATSMGVGASGTGTQRVVVANDAGKTLVSTGGSAASSGNNTLVAAGTNKLKVYAFSLSTTSTTAVTCIFQSGASGTELWRVILQAPTSVSTGANLVVQPPAWLFATASATLLNLNLSGAQTVHWSVSYFDEA